MLITAIPTDIEARLAWAGALERRHGITFGPKVHADVTAAAAAHTKGVAWVAPIHHTESTTGTTIRWAVVVDPDSDEVSVEVCPVDPADPMDLFAVGKQPRNESPADPNPIWAIGSVAVGILLMIPALAILLRSTSADTVQPVTIVVVLLPMLVVLPFTIVVGEMLQERFAPVPEPQNLARKAWNEAVDRMVEALPYAPDKIGRFRDRVNSAIYVVSDGSPHREQDWYTGTHKATGTPIEYRITTDQWGRLIPEYGLPGTLEDLTPPPRPRTATSSSSNGPNVWTGLGAAGGLATGLILGELLDGN